MLRESQWVEVDGQLNPFGCLHFTEGSRILRCVAATWQQTEGGLFKGPHRTFLQDLLGQLEWQRLGGTNTSSEPPNKTVWTSSSELESLSHR